MKRGWFTYTDLCVLLEQSAWRQVLTAIYQHFAKVDANNRFIYHALKTTSNVPV